MTDAAASSDTKPAYTGPERVFSGVQPSGDLHLGNYLGAIKKFVRLQHEKDCLFCVVDMHAITVWQDPKALAAKTREIAAAYLAAGIDPKKAIVFVQSAVPAHAELAWVFNCVARMGWLERMTQFKDKAGKDKERASVGLFVYPNLMSADILVYKATHVPVGEDQKQHLELARDTANKFNLDFDVPNFFPLPEPLIQGPGARVMSLKDGSKKMSKSDPAENSRISLSDDADAISRKIKKATSDSEMLPTAVEGLENRPEAKNLVSIYAALAGTTDADVLKEFGGKGFGVFKPALADLAVASLDPITSEMRRYMADQDLIDRVLADGAARARAIAEPILEDVKGVVGFWRD